MRRLSWLYPCIPLSRSRARPDAHRAWFQLLESGLLLASRNAAGRLSYRRAINQTPGRSGGWKRFGGVFGSSHPLVAGRDPERCPIQPTTLGSGSSPICQRVRWREDRQPSWTCSPPVPRRLQCYSSPLLISAFIRPERLNDQAARGKVQT